MKRSAAIGLLAAVGAVAASWLLGFFSEYQNPLFGGLAVGTMAVVALILHFNNRSSDGDWMAISTENTDPPAAIWLGEEAYEEDIHPPEENLDLREGEVHATDARYAFGFWFASVLLIAVLAAFGVGIDALVWGPRNLAASGVERADDPSLIGAGRAPEAANGEGQQEADETDASSDGESAERPEEAENRDEKGSAPGTGETIALVDSAPDRPGRNPDLGLEDEINGYLESIRAETRASVSGQVVRLRGCAQESGVAEHRTAIRRIHPEVAEIIDETAPILREGNLVDALLDQPVTVLFDYFQATVQESSIGALGVVASFLSDEPNRSITIEVGGHTDTAGKPHQNQRLSQARADEVVRLLVEEFGVSPHRLTAVGFGDSQPLSGTDGKDARNRRIEFVVLSGYECLSE